jgi:UDP:flavonoid glycosyltransferase YjiC (YdhE family)
MSLNVLLIVNECGDAGHIASTISKEKLVDFVEDKGYEAVEFQNEDYDSSDTVEGLKKECGYFTLQTLPNSEDTIGYGN